MNRLQIQLGFVLILSALLTGLGMPLFRSPRLGLAAHIVGITGGLVLIVLGALAGSFALGASRLTPIAGAGTAGDSRSEAVVSFLLQSLALAAIVGTVLAVWGFRKADTVEARQSIATGVAAPPV